MAITGAVLVSGKLHDDIKNHSAITTKKLGVFELKNVEQPVEIFAIANDTLSVPSVKDMKGKGNIKQRSIAVLPFTNMSTDPENEYFSDGISEEILNALVKVEDLKVTARTSSFAFKGKNTDIREIGKILNVESILEGSVRKSGNKVRITAQLISAIDGYHLWSESFDRDLEDIFAVQDEISKIITAQLRIKLSLDSHKQTLVKQPINNIEAYNLYLKGRYYWNKWSPENVKNAITLFHQAIELEPDYVAAYASLAGCYIFLAVSGISNPNEAYPKAFEYAEKALALDENNPDSLQSIAMVNFLFNKDRDKAVKIFDKVLELNPKHADAHHFYSMLLCVVGDLKKALAEIKAALQIDPL
jgi:TolB-like protein